MPKRKSLPKDVYQGLGENPKNNIVQKCHPLQTLAQTDLTLTDLKILDIYLSRIDSHNPSKRTVKIEKGVLENTLGIERIRKDTLTVRLKRLFQVVEIEDERYDDSINIISLFEKAAAVRNNDGLWEINLTCTEAAREYIFNIENLGYLNYRLRNILSLKSRYSYVLYLWIEKEHKRLHKNTWETSLDELKIILSCESVKSYEKYFRFNEKVLKPACNEIHEKTQLRYFYEAVKSGRTVKAVRFTVSAVTQDYNKVDVKYEDMNTNQVAINDEIKNQSEYCIVENKNSTYYSEAEQRNKFYHDAVPEFSDEEFEAILELLELVPEQMFPEDTPGGNSLDFRRYYYLKTKHAAMIKADKNKHITNRLAYFCGILNNDAGLK